MKIATLTFHRALNYGAVLQTYALQKVLLDLGYETEVLDYRSDFIEKHYQPDKISNYFTLKKMAILLLLNGCSKVKRSQFDSFVDNNIKMSDIIYSDKNIVNSEKLYDLFLVGSDQVWNPEYINSFEWSFALFANESQRIVYAASLGVDKIPERYLPQFTKSLQGLKNISLREEQAKIILWEQCHVDSTVVLDPTLLISKTYRLFSKGKTLYTDLLFGRKHKISTKRNQ